MAYQQIRNANPNTKGTAGWCLNMARRVFGVGSKYPTAWRAWLNTAHKHGVGEKLPNVAVPVWFSWKTAGHVAVWIPGRGILSSPIKGYGQLWAATPQELAAKITQATKSQTVYVGWSEDIEGVAVTHYVADPVQKGVATVNVPALYVRSAPNTSAPLAGSRKLKYGDKFSYKAVVTGGSYVINGKVSNQWYLSVYNHYVAAGGCK